jgi:hypothetical protein
MANNRLYIENTRTGERMIFCKTMGDGWYVFDPEELGDWLGIDCHDAAMWGNCWANTELRLVAENDKEGREATL